ncbi:DUF397 domain-containing protein [Streptomyces sp. NPDC006632]|uniref:DUF397 domain-containing protein n=1 Tax=Streptomyces sp. NPDC006632 TaxID=3157182 RepID=UPI0033B37ADA
MINEQTWTKSSYSGGEGNCVETKTALGTVMFRDSKLGGGSPTLTASPTAWDAFVTYAKRAAG